MAVAITVGMVAALPLSIVAAAWFQARARQAFDEACLASGALAITLLAGRPLRQQHPLPPAVPGAALWLAAAAAAALIVVRQTMEVASVVQVAAIQLRSFDATTSIIAALSAGAAVAWLSNVLATRLPSRERLATLRTCWAMFLAQTLIYAFHESAEAGLLPWSDVLHAATEPYGPDGVYGVHFSDLLVVAPLVVVGFMRLGGRVPVRSRVSRPLTPLNRHRPAVRTTICVSLFLLGMQQGDARPPQARPRANPDEIAAVVARPHVLIRHTGAGAAFGALAALPLDAPGGDRRLTDLTCQRLSFAGGRGLCLHLERGVFNTYTAVQLDKSLKAGRSIKLEGLPSRTRTAPDGRVGAVTVFVIGDDYAADFSTRTTLIDLEGGEEIGELEQFSTWRNGERIRAVDFNFWGVTFASDGNTFYAALRTAGKTYLVRGELALRRLTVLRENVECPSLSPDNRLLAYKKRIGPSPDSWRLHVLDLQSNVERIVDAETRYIDDQVEWLDARHILYGVPRRTTSTSDVWVAPIDGSEPARVFISDAESPIVVR
jgi:hypothetical protein